MILNHTADNLVGGTYTHGSSKDRFGGAHRNGCVNYHEWQGLTVVTTRKRYGSYRKAQRKLLQWLKGYSA